MKIAKFNIYTADLNPGFGTEQGKIRPVVIQTDSLNNLHQSTIVCLLTSKIKDAYPLRIYIPAAESSLREDSDIMLDQIRAIDNQRFIKYVGCLTLEKQQMLLECLRMVIFE